MRFNISACITAIRIQVLASAQTIKPVQKALSGFLPATHLLVGVDKIYTTNKPVKI